MNKKNQLSQRYSFQCCTLCCGKPTSTHVSYNISKETYVTLKIEKKVTLRDSVFHMASVNTKFSINSQEELSVKSYPQKFSQFY